MNEQFLPTSYSAFPKKWMNSKTIKTIRKGSFLSLLFLFCFFFQSLANDTEENTSQKTQSDTTPTKKYQVFDNWLTWKEAKTYCESLGGHLATITSKEELDFVLSILEEYPSMQYYWLGGSDEAKEGTWKWVTDEEWNYTNWNNGEPNDWQSNEDYLNIYNYTSESRGSWNDLSLSATPYPTSKFGFICEWDTPGIYSVSPNVAVSSEKSIEINISAYSISLGSRIELINGSNTIKSDSILEINNYNIKARFLLENKPLGQYDMIIISPTNDTMRLDKCFFLQDIKSSINTGLVAFYPFNGNANDESGSGRNGIIYGASLTPDHYGMENSSFILDGINDYISLGNWFNLQDFSISFWVNVGNTQVTYADIIDNNHTDYRSWVMQQCVDNTNTFSFGATSAAYSKAFTLDPKKWYNIVLIHSSSIFKFFINDVLIEKQAIGKRIVYDGTQQLSLGHWGGGGRYLKGSFDDVRIYNRGLTDSEVNYIFNKVPDSTGIFNVNPKIAFSNDKYTDLTVYAFPIDSNCNLLLNKEGIIIKPDSILEIGSYYINARFSLQDKPIGNYDVLLVSSNDSMKLEKCFSIYPRSNAIEPTDTDNDGLRNIASFGHIVWITQHNESWSWNYELDNDLDAYETKYWNDGIGLNPIAEFSGTIDGQGHTIKSLHFNRPNQDNVALFGKLSSTGEIRNLGLTSCNIIGRNSSGALIGSNNGGRISNCYTNGTVKGNENVGGLVGYNGGLIKFCYNSAFVNGIRSIGGLVGNSNGNNSITMSYNLGKVIGSGYNVGGIIGTHYGKITDCFNAGSVIGAGEVAGISGWNYGVISNTYNKGNINGTGIYCGAMIGYQSGSITNSFWDKENSGLTTSNGGTGKTTAEMKIQSTYTDWDFANSWEILSTLNDGYPQLSWAKTTSLIKSYSPDRIANVGKASIVFEGIGFDDNTKLYLVGEKLDTINTDSVLIVDDFCEAIFDFDNTTIGAYDIFVQFPDTTITFKKGFNIEALKDGGLEIEILGPNQFRSGKNFSVEVVVSNNSNQYVSNRIINLDIESNGSEISLPSDPDPVYIPDGAELPGDLNFPPLTKLPEGEKIQRGQFSPKPIPPYGKRTMTVDIKSTSPVKIKASESPYNVNDLVNFYLSPEQKQIECDYEYWRCRNDWTKSILDATSLDKQAEDLAWALGGALPGKTGDYVSVLGMANKAWDNDFISVIGNFTTWTLGKLGEAAGLITKRVALLAEINGILYSNIGVQLWSSYKAQKQCGEIRDICMSPYGSPIYSSLPVGSFDPNDKYGYRSPSGSKYFNEDKANFTYVIEFENKETATAAAQEVFVTDTLDAKVFDIQSFKAGSIKIGGKTYDASFNARDAKWTIDMRPDMNYITYVTLKLDTATGVAQWYFKSVDPVTLDWPTDPTAGFLPPNDSTGRGTGSVSFTIDLKKGLSDETDINNKATIVFDTNDPIVTPTWSNKKDIVAPTSSMFEPDIVGDNKALIGWEGEDNKNGSGLFCYNLYMKKGTENYTPLLQRSALKSIDFEFEKDVKYSFYVTAIDSAENVETKTNVPEINLEITEVFAISKKWDDVLVCNNTGSKYTSYQWYKNGNPIQDANEQFYQETGGLNGSYFVMVTTTDGKIGISNVISVGNNTKSVKVYPNPSEENREYTIEVKAEESELTGGDLIVTNVNGQLITRRNGLQPQMKLNGLIRGVYLVKVQFANGESFNEKLIVK